MFERVSVPRWGVDGEEKSVEDGVPRNSIIEMDLHGCVELDDSLGH